MPVIQSFNSFTPTPHNQSAEFSVQIGGDALIQGSSATGATFRVKIGGDVEIKGETIFILPPPFVDEIEENAFAVQIYTARLLDENNNEILITDATRDQPKGEIGERVSLTVGRKDLSLIAIDKRYTFQIGVWSNLQDAIDGDDPTWKTVCENARLITRNYSIARSGKLPSDSLTFEIIESDKNKLNFYPVRNYILFDPLQTDVDLDDSEKTYTSDGDYIRTTANAFPGLTFYKILNFVKERCGFSGVEKNIPNFPVIRADFPFNQSYAKSLAGIGGMYKPVYSIQPGNILRVQTKFANLPEDFEPRGLTINDYRQLNLSIPQTAHVDGITITSNAKEQFSYFVQRFEPDEFDNDRFGLSGYVRTEIEEEFYDYFDADDNYLDTEKVGEIRKTFLDEVQTGEIEMRKTLDSQGYVTRQVNSVRSRVPLPSNGFEPTLELVSEKEYLPAYKTDSRRPRQKAMTRAITNFRSIVVTDTENQYLGEDFAQIYMEAHKTGNLTESILFSEGLEMVKTFVDTFKEQNGQTTVTRDVVNHLRIANTDDDAETASGAPTLRGSGNKQKRFTLWADGVSTNSRTGGEIIELAVGELPLKFAKVLGRIILDQRLNGFSEGNLSIPGYHESLQRGVFFRVFDREGNSLGRFICESVNTTFSNLRQGKNQSVFTSVNVSEV